jgi:hypothetical protein
VAYKGKLRALGILVVVVSGFIAMPATSASAAWLEGGAAIGAPKTVEFGTHVEGKLTVVNESNLEALCAVIRGNATEPVKLINGTTEAKGKLAFETCKVWQNGNNITATCPPLEPVFTNTLKAQLFLSGEKNYVLVSPSAGTLLVELNFPVGCALPANNAIRGALVFECLKPSKLEPVDCKQEEVVHQLKPNETFADKLTYGMAAKAATLSVIGTANLASGNPWCGHI